MKTRYYLHGDYREDGTIFCSRCDAFVSINHLYEEHKAPEDAKESDYVRAKREFKAFYSKAGQERLGAKFFRPQDAKNHEI